MTILAAAGALGLITAAGIRGYHASPWLVARLLLLPLTLAVVIGSWLVLDFAPIGWRSGGAVILGLVAFGFGYHWCSKRSLNGPARHNAVRWLNAGITATSIAAALWLGLAIMAVAKPSPAPRPVPINSNTMADTSLETTTVWQELGVVASGLVSYGHEHVLTHLPLVGPISDEVDATIHILSAASEHRRMLCGELGIDNLANDPLVHTMLNDSEYAKLLDEASLGNPLTLMRLIDHPFTHQLAEHPQLEALLNQRPSALSHQLKVIEAQNSSESPP